MTRLYSAIVMLLAILSSSASAGNLDDIREALQNASTSQTQEKVYLHTDNQCYFVGDTLWYKAYVVRADNLQPTDMSRLLYVELLSPDGLLVERQTIIVSPKGYTCGQFALTDSLYSGYYELRAYTRWMLNFNVREHYYRTDETWWFYNKKMAADYFRVWDGLYSRVLPIYSKPDTKGDYDSRRMYQRPKTRLPRQKKDDLVVTFYPEGGHLIEGVENRVAFDITDQHGEAVNIKGTVTAEGQQPFDIQTEYMGRGSFTVTPTNKRMKATFTWRDKEWDIRLPKSEEQGAAFRLEGKRLTILASNLPQDKDYAVSILCRGSLKHFEQVSLNSPSTTIELPLEKLPSGVADVTLFDSDGQILADRLLFVNNHEHDKALITTTIQKSKTFAPYERIELPIQLEGVSEPMNFSLSIRDSYTDEPTYDNGNLMTDLLLSSELRGFIAYPAHYFEADDDLHRRHLDLLMMVQGWRKYKWQELAEGDREMRYQPEQTLTVEGAVYKMLNLTPVEPDEVSAWQDGVGMRARKTNQDEEYVDPWAETKASDGIETISATSGFDDINPYADDIEFTSLDRANDHLGVNHGNLKREVLVEAEISVDGEYAGSIQKTQGGRFVFEIPPFYGMAYLNMKAYKVQDSIRKNMSSRSDAKILDEDAFPDFYIKRDLFYPMYTHDYTFYEKHQPEIDFELYIDTVSDWSMENDMHMIQNVNVQGRRRGRRAVDWKKPAFVMDAYDLYNDVTDRGLSFGKLDMRQFPVQVCKYLFGNMNRPVSYNVDGRLEGATYYRNYSPLVGDGEAEEAGFFRANRTSQYMYEQLKLKRLQDIRIFTDFEPRTEDSLMVYESHSPDAIVDMVLIPNNGVQPTFRDRHIVFRGINMAESFYSPDYSDRHPAEPTDYRRTLYWNPNAKCDDEGRFTATFYNNSKETRITMTAAGISSDGRLMHSK